MKIRASAFLALVSLCGMTWGASLYFDRAGTTGFKFNDDGTVGDFSSYKQTPPGTPAAGTLLMERSGTKLWSYNPQPLGVYVFGGSDPVTMTAPLTFENTTTKSKVQLSENGDLVGTESGLQLVETYDGSRTMIDDRAKSQYTEFESFGEGRIEYTTAANGTVTEQVKFYYKDHLGTTRAVMNENWVLVEGTRYYAYGEMKPIAYAGATPPTYSTDVAATEKFTGKEYDGDGAVAGVTGGMGLQYFGFRYYDPETGAWTSPDPLNQFFNPYGYHGNPTAYVDPNGAWFDLGISEILAQVAIAIVVAYLVKSIDNAITKDMGWEGFAIWNWDEWCNGGVGVSVGDGGPKYTIDDQEYDIETPQETQQEDQEYQDAMNSFTQSIYENYQPPDQYSDLAYDVAQALSADPFSGTSYRYGTIGPMEGDWTPMGQVLRGRLLDFDALAQCELSEPLCRIAFEFMASYTTDLDITFRPIRDDIVYTFLSSPSGRNSFSSTPVGDGVNAVFWLAKGYPNTKQNSHIAAYFDGIVYEYRPDIGYNIDAYEIVNQSWIDYGLEPGRFVPIEIRYGP